MDDYDQACRFAVRLDPPGFVRWLLGPAALAFRQWLDTRTVPFPGEADRVLDRVAHLDDPARPGEPVALDLEFQTENDPDILERVLEYVARLRREVRHGPGGRGQFRVVAAVVNLTGPAQPDALDMRLDAPAGVGLRLQVVVRTLRTEGAAGTLEDVAAGRTSRVVLPLIPLMRGGGTEGTIAMWKQVAAAEPDDRLRSNYAGLIRFFARLTRAADAWTRALEGWNVPKSPVAEEWRTEGRVEMAQADLLKAIELKFRTAVPADLREAIQALTDLNELDRWFRLVFPARSLAAYRRAVGR